MEDKIEIVGLIVLIFFVLFIGIICGFCSGRSMTVEEVINVKCPQETEISKQKNNSFWDTEK